MDKYYFFGVGGNCHKAIEFWGADSVIALVDNSSVKIGTTVMGLSVISFDEFLGQWNGETVVITANIYADQIAQQLKDSGICNYFICPYMQSGFYSCDEIIKRLNLMNYDKLIVYDKNPLSQKLMLELKKLKRCEIHYIINDITEKDIKDEETLLVAKQDFNSVFLNSNKPLHIINLFEEIQRMQLEDFGYLKKYEGIHTGASCFLIGNGPSLKEKDLDTIHKNGTKSIGCNRIYKIFEKTEWRPHYYVIGDNLVWDEERNNLPNESIYFIRKTYNNQLSGSDLDAQFYYGKFENYYPQYPTFSDDVTRGIYGGRTVMFDMLQIAVYMGFKEIYLLGVDFSWGEDGKDTHFCKDYMNDELVKENIRYKEEQEHAYIAAKNYADSHGIKIYNATRGGHLEVFERVDFDKIFL